MDNVQDPQQFELFRAGSMEAFSWFYNRYHQQVYLYARKLSQQPDLAMDFTILAFTSLWDHREKTKDETHLRNYLFSIVRLHFLQHLRKTRKADAAEEEMVYRLGQTAYESGEFIETVFAAIEECMRRLPRQQRLVMELLYFKEIDVQSISRMLEISPQTVRNHKAQALRFLRAEVDPGIKK